MSYDSVEMLAHFAARKRLTVPMLSDPESEIIRRFGVFNETIPPNDVREYGIPHPGTFIVDERGFIRDKFFEEKYIHRLTMATILTQAFVQPPAARSSRHEADHVTVTTTATEDRVRPGNRFTLIIEVAPAPGVHIYAPGAERYGYHPLAVTIEAPPYSTVYPPQFPEAEIMEFPALEESVPVYTRPLRILADVALGSRKELADQVSAAALVIQGRVAVQACDEAECYAPQEIPVTWELALEPMDTERAPEQLRRDTASGVRPA
jgi:hypothetical protein